MSRVLHGTGCYDKQENLQGRASAAGWEQQGPASPGEPVPQPKPQPPAPPPRQPEQIPPGPGRIPEEPIAPTPGPPQAPPPEPPAPPTWADITWEAHAGRFF